METRVQGRHYEVSDALKRHVQQKLGRLDRYLDRASDAQVEITREATRSAADRYGVQATLWIGGTIVRAEHKAADVFQAVDAVMDFLQERLVRFKGKHYRRTGHRRPAPTGVAMAPPEAPAEPDLTEPEALLDIVRVKRVPLKPMAPEEAIEQLELLGHDFYLFHDAGTDRVSVLYRRHDGGYGLLQPEPA